jgi:hypothetical protein
VAWEYKQPAAVEARHQAQIERDLHGNTEQISLLKMLAFPTPAWNTTEQKYHAVVNGYCVRLSHREDCEWHPRKHYPINKTTTRQILIRGLNQVGEVEIVDRYVDAWRGNYLLDTLIAAGVIASNKSRMDVRLHAAYDIREVRRGKHVTIFERTLAGEHIDFCAKRGSLTFHAASDRDAVKGLHAKAKAAALRACGRAIDWNLGRSLGFCETGMRQFCTVFGLDTKQVLRPAELAEIVKADLTAAAPFAAELKVLANAVGFALPEWAH